MDIGVGFEEVVYFDDFVIHALEVGPDAVGAFGEAGAGPRRGRRAGDGDIAHRRAGRGVGRDVGVDGDGAAGPAGAADAAVGKHIDVGVGQDIAVPVDDFAGDALEIGPDAAVTGGVAVIGCGRRAGDRDRAYSRAGRGMGGDRAVAGDASAVAAGAAIGAAARAQIDLGAGDEAFGEDDIAVDALEFGPYAAVTVHGIEIGSGVFRAHRAGDGDARHRYDRIGVGGQALGDDGAAVVALVAVDVEVDIGVGERDEEVIDVDDGFLDADEFGEDAGTLGSDAAGVGRGYRAVDGDRAHNHGAVGVGEQVAADRDGAAVAVGKARIDVDIGVAGEVLRFDDGVVEALEEGLGGVGVASRRGHGAGHGAVDIDEPGGLRRVARHRGAGRQVDVAAGGGDLEFRVRLGAVGNLLLRADEEREGVAAVIGRGDFARYGDVAGNHGGFGRHQHAAVRAADRHVAGRRIDVDFGVRVDLVVPFAQQAGEAGIGAVAVARRLNRDAGNGDVADLALAIGGDADVAAHHHRAAGIDVQIRFGQDVVEHAAVEAEELGGGRAAAAAGRNRDVRNGDVVHLRAGAGGDGDAARRVGQGHRGAGVDVDQGAGVGIAQHRGSGRTEGGEECSCAARGLDRDVGDGDVAHELVMGVGGDRARAVGGDRQIGVHRQHGVGVGAAHDAVVEGGDVTAAADDPRLGRAAADGDVAGIDDVGVGGDGDVAVHRDVAAGVAGPGENIVNGIGVGIAQQLGAVGFFDAAHRDGARAGDQRIGQHHARPGDGDAAAGFAELTGTDIEAGEGVRVVAVDRGVDRLRADREGGRRGGDLDVGARIEIGIGERIGAARAFAGIDLGERADDEFIAIDRQVAGAVGARLQRHRGIGVGRAGGFDHRRRHRDVAGDGDVVVRRHVQVGVGGSARGDRRDDGDILHRDAAVAGDRNAAGAVHQGGGRRQGGGERGAVAGVGEDHQPGLDRRELRGGKRGQIADAQEVADIDAGLVAVGVDGDEAGGGGNGVGDAVAGAEVDEPDDAGAAFGAGGPQRQVARPAQQHVVGQVCHGDRIVGLDDDIGARLQLGLDEMLTDGIARRGRGRAVHDGDVGGIYIKGAAGADLDVAGEQHVVAAELDEAAIARVGAALRGHRAGEVHVAGGFDQHGAAVAVGRHGVGVHHAVEIDHRADHLGHGRGGDHHLARARPQGAAVVDAERTAVGGDVAHRVGVDREGDPPVAPEIEGIGGGGGEMDLAQIGRDHAAIRHIRRRQDGEAAVRDGDVAVIDDLRVARVPEAEHVVDRGEVGCG